MDQQANPAWRIVLLMVATLVGLGALLVSLNMVMFSLWLATHPVEHDVIWERRALFWLLAAVTALFAVGFALRALVKDIRNRFWSRGRTTPGLRCTTCGYDMAGLAGVCPECGTSPAPTQDHRP